jgi:DNA polymerase I-like protein with 3'-5' exonuclease and polymerase domains
MFGQITGRTNVSTSRSPYSAPKWLRGFIKPDKNKILAELDWSAQEAGIMAYLSKDQNMIKDFKTGNIYLLPAIKNGAAPEGAIKSTHPEIRNQYKVAVLGCGYGQTAFGLKYALKIPVFEAETIIQNIKNTYPDFFKWNVGVCCGATSRGYFQTKYGWRYWIPKIYKPNTLKNWMMQSHGSEILRRAMIAVDEAGIEISMIMHDAILIHVDRKGCAGKLKQVQRIMELAAKDVLGAIIPVEIKIIKRNYKLDKDVQEKWDRIMSIYNKSRCSEKLHLKKRRCN